MARKFKSMDGNNAAAYVSYAFTEVAGIYPITPSSPMADLNWHIHHAKSGGGQLLICVDGEGWYQEEGKPAQSLSVGDVVTIPANVKHWHGAKADSWFSHIAVEVPGEDCRNEWCEPVSDTEYNAL